MATGVSLVGHMGGKVMRIGVIGTGTIATAVVRGVAKTHEQIIVGRRSKQNSESLANQFSNVSVEDNQSVLDQSDVVLIGLLSEDSEAVLSELRFKPDQKVVSMMAGVGLDTVAQMIKPAFAASVMIPFPGIETGGSPVIALGDIELVQDIVTARNTVYGVNCESELSAFLCAQAALSPIASTLADAAYWLGERVSDETAAEAFLRHLVSSSLTNTGTQALINALNTPGGYNQRLRIAMEQSGMREALLRGLTELNSP